MNLKPIDSVSHRKVSGSSKTEESQSVIKDVRAATPKEKIEPTPHKKKADTMAQALKPESYSRPITREDIINLLISIKQQPSVKNQLIASTLLQQGLEVSEKNFAKVARFSNMENIPNIIKSIVLALTRGLDSFKSADMISKFLLNDTQLASQLQKATAALKNYSTIFQFSRELFNPQLFNSFAAVISEMNEELQKWMKQSGKDSKSLRQFISLDKGKMVSSLKSFYELLGGIGQKIADPNIQQQPIAQSLSEQIQNLKKEILSTIEAISTQAVLSKDSILHNVNNYFYFQFPNPDAQPPGDIDLLIKKSNGKKAGAIDPENTTLILRLETTDLGEIYTKIDVKPNKKISFTFQTDRTEVKQEILSSASNLKETMEEIGYTMVGFHTARIKLDVKKEIFPSFDLDSFPRIKTEV
ncbi:flagellar hook-length control protein FliK [Candidatus Margulisiibacteriota bacterium]